VACSGGATRAVWPVKEENSGGSAPVVVSSEEEVGELPGSVGKLEVASIGGEEGRKGVLHGEQEAVAGGDRRQWCSGQNLMAFRGW
jgi:hypothetical protein